MSSIFLADLWVDHHLTMKNKACFIAVWCEWLHYFERWIPLPSDINTDTPLESDLRFVKSLDKHSCVLSVFCINGVLGLNQGHTCVNLTYVCVWVMDFKLDQKLRWILHIWANVTFLVVNVTFFSDGDIFDWGTVFPSYDEEVKNCLIVENTISTIEKHNIHYRKCNICYGFLCMSWNHDTNSNVGCLFPQTSII